MPVYVDLIESNPPRSDGLPEPVIAPALGEGNHLSYAAQWFIFSTAVAVGWVLAVRRSIGTRARPTTGLFRSGFGTPTGDPQPEQAIG